MMTHKDLEVWKRAVQFVVCIYEITRFFPKEEIYGLTSQTRRAAVSIPSNIAEGASRQSTKEFIRFLYIALGSCMELETQLIISEKLAYLTASDKQKIMPELTEIAKMLNGLISFQKRKLST
ncbi:MAG TPA: four helix bundle protein [Sphingobacterium sp.]|nr:four helix bundle protein [Sphingobacterium sp.]